MGLLESCISIQGNKEQNKNVYANIRRSKGQEQEHAGATWLLALSYDDLLYHLKPCFLYLGQFPEDYEIPVNKLANLWTPEGFISLAQHRQSSVETMEGIAYNCLTELVERCVAEVGERGSVRKIKT